MYAISLTSIPPRLERLGSILGSLLAQNVTPAEIILCLPRAYARFPGPVSAPTLPAGVRLLWAAQDHGPATKAIAPARAMRGHIDRLIWCDDDWIYPPHWAGALLAAAGDGASTGQGWSVERIGRRGTGCDIAQGFAGVCVRPEWLCTDEVQPPPEVHSVDDVWLSGQLARQNIPIRAAPRARQGMRPAYEDTHGLQDAGGRDAANRACAALLNTLYGIWPEQGA